jgi:DNA-directed RNA polymerase specialized sigma24 family protein
MLANRGRILAAAESGDRDAFLGLYDQFGPMLYRFFFWLTGNEKETRELVIATFRRAFRSIRKRPTNMVLDTWFYRIAVGTFLAHTRWDRISRRAPATIEFEDRSTAWRAAVVELAPKLRVIWVLTLAEGMPQGQTAEAVGVSLDRAEVLLERARAAFRPPEVEAARVTVDRAMRQLTAPRPGATLRAEVAAILGTGDTTVRNRLLQGGIGVLVLVLAVSVAFSLLRDEEVADVGPEQAKVEPKSIVVLGMADSGAMLAFNAVDLQPSRLIGVGDAPRDLSLSPDGETLYVLQEEGLLTVDARSLQVGRLFRLPEGDWGALAAIGRGAVVGSHIEGQLLLIDENGEVTAEISLPWPVDRLVLLNDKALLALAVDRTAFVQVNLDDQAMGSVIAIGNNLALGAVVPNHAGDSAYVTTPATEEVWLVALGNGQAELVASMPAARATRGGLSADGALLYLSIELGPVVTPTPDDEDASVKSTVPQSTSTPSRNTESQDSAQDEVAVPVAPELPALTMVNLADGSIERQLWQAGGTSQLALDPARNILYALAPHSNAILVIDSQTFHVRNAVPLAVKPVAFTLTSED